MSADDNPPAVAHKRWWQIFEVIVGLPFLVAIPLHLIFPWRFLGIIPSPARITVGVALVIIGIVIIVLARRELARLRQPTDPGQPTSAIVSSGIFAVSRNPLYLGGIVLLVGLALALNLPWALVLLLPAIIACQIVLITPEEQYLVATFGNDYRQYAARVHRWLGRTRKKPRP